MKTLLAIGAAWILRGNKLAAAVAVTLHDLLLPLWPFVLRIQYDLGYWLLSHPHEWPVQLEMHEFTLSQWLRWSTFLTVGQPLLLGSVLFSVPFVLVAYFFTHWFLLRRRQAKTRT